MHIVHVITDLGTGGAERMLARLVTAQRADGERHTVISLRGLSTTGPALVAAGIAVHTMTMTSPGALASGFTRLVRLLRRLRPDAVQTWLYHADFIGGLAARAAGIRAVAWNIRTADIRSGISLSRGATAIRRLCGPLSRRLPARIVYVAHAAQRVHEAAGYDPTKGVVISNGFAVRDPNALHEARARIRNEFGVADHMLLLGTAGTFNHQKNQVGFVAACAAVAIDYPDARFVLIGRNNTKQNPELSAALQATGVAERFLLLGERADIHDCLAALDLFCLASRGEGFPNVVGEAMAAGVPCIVTDVGDAALLVGDTGWAIPVDDPLSLRTALAAAAAERVEHRRTRGEQARTRIAGDFSMAAVLNRYSALYRELTAGTEKGRS